MPTVPKTVLQAGGRPSNPYAGTTTAEAQRGLTATGQAVVENVLPGASDAAAARESYVLGQAIGPALREGRYGDAIRAFLDSTGAAIGTLPMVPSLAGVIRAFHGTPHQFDKFDLSKIGTGEGVQAYGRGLYFAENEGIADYYREKLSSRRYTAQEPAPLLVDGKPVEEVFPDLAPKIREDLKVTMEESRPGGMDEAAELMADNESLPELAPLYAAIREGRVTAQPGGHLYGVDLDVNHEDLLDWDKPLSEQSPKVQAALAKLRGYPEDRSGAMIYMDTGLAFGRQYPGTRVDEAAAAKLREAGIPGIRYLDAGSRGGGEGSRNVVIFDDSLAQIVERNGQPVAVPKPAADRAAEGMGALAAPEAWLKD